MPVSVEQFIRSLADSGLLTAEEVRAFLAGLSPDERPDDTQGLARQLIRAGKLTKYQASAVYRGKTKGLVFDEYVILDKIGAGGMGQVLKARHRKMERIVALKFLPPKAMSSPDAVKRFYREVRAAAKLAHPNIVTAYDAREQDGIHGLVMEYVDGKDLSDLIAERGPLPVDEAVDYVIQAARGLQYAHAQGVVHRDVKPSNLLVDREGRVKILDMGLARMIETGLEGQTGDSDRLTASSQVMGTCDYMAPEQAEDTHAADQRADVYSLGCTLFRLLTAKKPYEGDTLVSILLAHREAPIPSLCQQRPDLPAELDQVFRKMVAKRPQDRYQSMSEVIAALEACVASREPASRAVAREASSDSALTAFLEGLAQGRGTRGEPASKPGEETIPSQVERETDRNVWQRLVRGDRRKTLIFAGVAAACTLFLVLLGVVFTRNTPRGTPLAEDDRATAAIPPETSRPSLDPAEADRNRRAAEWMLEMGGTVSVLIDGSFRTLKAMGDLPKEHFWIIYVDLNNSGRVDDAGLEHLRGLANIEMLTLAQTPVTDAGLVNLEGLTKLYFLALAGTQVTDAGLAKIEHLTGMKVLFLNKIEVTDAGLRHLRRMHQLEKLVLNETPVSGPGLEHLVQIPTLRILHLEKTQVDDAGLQHLQKMTQLRELNLLGTRVSGVGLEHLQGLTELETLNLLDTDVDDAGLAHLEGMTKLRSLCLLGTEVTDAGLRHLRPLSALEALDLSWNEVTGSGLEDIEPLTNLTELYLRGSKLTAQNVDRLESFTGLELLDLDGTPVNDAGLEHLKKLTRLKEIRLKSTQVTDAGVRDFQAALPNCKIVLKSDAEDAPKEPQEDSSPRAETRGPVES